MKTEINAQTIKKLSWILIDKIDSSSLNSIVSEICAFSMLTADGQAVILASDAEVKRAKLFEKSHSVNVWPCSCPWRIVEGDNNALRVEYGHMAGLGYSPAFDPAGNAASASAAALFCTGWAARREAEILKTESIEARPVTAQRKRRI